MSPDRTTESGHTLTMVTEVGGRPATRQAIERLCRERHNDDEPGQSPHQRN